MRRMLCILGLVIAMGLVAGNAEAKPLKIKLATMAPDGSSWHELLKDLAQSWKEVSNGQIDLRIYAGGVAGSETVMMKLLGINNYHAALVSSLGLGSIDRSPLVFTIPRMLRTNEELETAMEIMAPELGRRLEEKGYVVLGWADAGWIKFSGLARFTMGDGAGTDVLRIPAGGILELSGQVRLQFKTSGTPAQASIAGSFVASDSGSAKSAPRSQQKR